MIRLAIRHAWVFLILAGFALFYGMCVDPRMQPVVRLKQDPARWFDKHTRISADFGREVILLEEDQTWSIWYEGESTRAGGVLPATALIHEGTWAIDGEDLVLTEHDSSPLKRRPMDQARVFLGKGGLILLGANGLYQGPAAVLGTKR